MDLIAIIINFLSNINILFYLAAYLIGAIPFGLILAKKFANVNIKDSGSGSIGATNVLRVVKESNPELAKKLGAATLALDAIKGMAVLFAGYIMGVSEATMWAIAVFAILGHCYSPYLNFEGGKGVATGLGVLMFMLPIETIIGMVVWGVSAKLTKISSLSSLLGLVSIVVASFIIHPQVEGINTHTPIVIIAFVIIYKHLPNIMRLISGQEGKVV
jgi:glycerol-3-phosphate acyltransferase PlsY